MSSLKWLAFLAQKCSCHPTVRTRALIFKHINNLMFTICMFCTPIHLGAGVYVETVLLCSFSKSHGPGAQRMTVRSADEETKVRSCGCHLHWITLSQCSPATVWGRGLVRSPGVREGWNITQEELTNTILSASKLDFSLQTMTYFKLPWRSLIMILLS